MALEETHKLFTYDDTPINYTFTYTHIYIQTDVSTYLQTLCRIHHVAYVEKRNPLRAYVYASVR